MTWLNENAGAVQALATIVLVIVTIAYVIITNRLNKTTKKVVDATLAEVEATRAEVEVSRQLVEVASKQADAASAQAEATRLAAEEAQRARLTAHLPVVLGTYAGAVGGHGGYKLKIHIKNYGDGPALGVRWKWIAMEGAAAVASSDYVELTPAMPTLELFSPDVGTGDDNALRAIDSGGTDAIAVHVRYLDINGAEFETIVRGAMFRMGGVNDAGRFALGQDPYP